MSCIDTSPASQTSKGWRHFLSSVCVRDLLPPQFRLISAEAKDKIPDVLELMKQKNVMCVPVYDKTAKKWIGMVDMLDFVMLIASMSFTKQIADVVNRKEVPWQEFLDNELRVFIDQPVDMICNASTRNQWISVNENSPVNSLMDMFCSQRDKLHRVAVVNNEGEVVGIVSQWRLIQWLAQNVNKFPFADCRIGNAGTTPVVSIELNQPAIEGFSKMVSQQVSGLAVIDSKESGKLVASLSSSDVKGSLPPNVFQDLYLPISLYLEKSTLNFPRELARKPVTVVPQDTWKRALELLSMHHIHRLFVVDEASLLCGVLSLSDVILYCSGLRLDQQAEGKSP